MAVSVVGRRVLRGALVAGALSSVVRCSRRPARWPHRNRSSASRAFRCPVARTLVLKTACRAMHSIPQAGGTPYGLTTTLDFNMHESVNRNGAHVITSVEEPKDIKVDFPPGVVFDPQATPRCSIAVFDQSRGPCVSAEQPGRDDSCKSVRQRRAESRSTISRRWRVVPPSSASTTRLNFVITGGVNTGEGYTSERDLVGHPGGRSHVGVGHGVG